MPPQICLALTLISVIGAMIAVPGTTAAQLPLEQRIGAIHVQIPFDNNSATNAQLIQELYSKCNKRSFPHGVAMRLVPPCADALNFASQAKLERSCSRQAGFRDTLMHATVSSFVAIDFKSTLFNKSLHDFIMEEKAKGGYQLFHSADESWQGGHSLHYRPGDERAASMLINGGLLPKLY